MTDYKVGQRVHVEFEGVITDLESKDCCLKVETAQGFNHYVYVDKWDGPQADTGAKVTLADPENWPPQVGDIWEAAGKEYFAVVGWGIVALVPAEDGRAQDLKPFKTLNPVLVRRRGQ
jgi:hypothetical protein